VVGSFALEEGGYGDEHTSRFIYLYRKYMP